MFSSAANTISKSIYGVLCNSSVGPQQLNFSNGTAFMIAEGICVTAAHVLHADNDWSKPVHSKIEVIRSPEIGSPMNESRLIAEDAGRDIALIEILKPRHHEVVTFHKTILARGTSCGSLGFPLANIATLNNRPAFNLVERFQGAYLSAYKTMPHPNGNDYVFYETDSLMYGGSSGCPGFTLEANVFGMHVATVSEGKSNSNTSRLAISLWVPSSEIIQFATKHGISKLRIT